MVKVSRINIENEGLEKFFSTNETRILEFIWNNPQTTSTDIREQLPDLSLACVAGTLDRLVKSEFVTRELDDSSSRLKYRYMPAMSRDEVGLKLTERVLESLVDTFGLAVTDNLDILVQRIDKKSTSKRKGKAQGRRDKKTNK